MADNRKTYTLRDEEVGTVRIAEELITVIAALAATEVEGVSGLSTTAGAELAELIDAPVCDTLMGKGAFDGYSDRYTGMIGMHGTKASNLGVSECDLLIALGARFSDRVTGNPKKFAENAKIIHIDIDTAEINKNIRVNASLIGDLKLVLQDLNAKIEKQDHSEWMAHVKDLKEKFPMKYEKDALSCP